MGSQKKASFLKAVWFTGMLLMAASAAPALALAQAAYPAKPVRFVLSMPAGSGSDALARFLARRMGELTSQPFIVENRPGGDGVIAANALLAAPRDGYTLTLGSNSIMGSNAAIFKSLPYSPTEDFIPIARINFAPNVVVVPANSPYKSLRDLVADAKARPGKLSFAAASGSHNVATHALMQVAQFEALSVPYPGPPKALLDLAAGTNDFMLVDYPAAAPLLQSGRLRALVVTTAARIPAQPELPTLAEAGVPGFSYASWAGLFAPVKTPPEVIQKMTALARQIVNEPETKAFFDRSGTIPAWIEGDDFRKFQVAEIEFWRATMIKARLPQQ